ncbi:ATP-binding protein [Streptomyces sp. 900116325]
MATVASKRTAGYLPADVTSFVGRRREVGTARQLLSQTRLLTLCGPGGVGKTRLSLRVASEVRRAFKGGVWFVELAPLHDDALLARTIAGALGVSDESSRPAIVGLSQYLADRQLLIVLDNCEHLLDGCAVVLGKLLTEAPQLRVIATSRQALGIEGEQVMMVPPLSMPTSQTRSADAALQCEAVSLFKQRAVAAAPQFEITDHNAGAVVRVCQRLDGFPLAIELAAVRLRALPVEELLDRLDDRFTLLTTGNRSALERHQTLRATIDWSYDLCSPQERRMWARLSVFSGGCDLRAAEQVCSGNGIDQAEVFDLVAGLVEKSILIRQESTEPQARYQLMETVRQYGRERLAATGEEADLRRRHRDYYQQMAEQAETEWCSPRQVHWYTQLRLDLANLRSALDYSFTQSGQAEQGLRIASHLRDYWMALALSEGRHWLDRGLALARRPTSARLRALWGNVWIAALQGDRQAAQDMLEESRVLVEELGDGEAQARIWQSTAAAALYARDVETARPLLWKALEWQRGAGDKAAECTTRFYLGLGAAWHGDDDADTLCDQLLALCVSSGATWAKSKALWLAGYNQWRKGELESAAALIREGLELQRPIGDHRGFALGTEVLAWVTAAQGDYKRAALLLGSAQTIWRTLGTSLSGLAHLVDFHAECVSKLKQKLGEEKFHALLREAADLTADQAVACALEEKGTPEKAQADQPEFGALPALTRRELQIAKLLAEGLSNKEIAARLVISPRTVEGHVEHILTKLSFTSRAQIAGWIAAQG